MIWAKRKKENLLNEQKILEREASNRKLLVETQWSYDQTDSYMKYRANGIFEGKFSIDTANETIYKLLCHYFSNDINFIKLATDIGVKLPSLEKGLLLGGMIGVGKTWMMKLFSKNQRQVFTVRSAVAISDAYMNQSKDDHDKGKDPLEQFYHPAKLAINDANHFYHKFLGLCLDDIGTEEIKNSYGNRKNVVGDFIEKRYSLGHTGIMLHMTTNLTMGQIKEFYGDRVSSRLRETMNIIELKGVDRRK